MLRLGGSLNRAELRSGPAAAWFWEASLERLPDLVRARE